MVQAEILRRSKHLRCVLSFELTQRRPAERLRGTDGAIECVAQMRLVSAFEIVNHALSMALTAGMAGMSLWLWSGGHVGVGAVAAATAMALRLQGMSHWIMWEMTSLFESVGTVQDGIHTLSRPRAVVDAPLLPGVELLLRTIPYRQTFFVVSATPQGELEEILHKLDLTQCFARIYGAPIRKKDAIQLALAGQGLEPSDCLMIGDALADLEAAKANAALLKKAFSGISSGKFKLLFSVTANTNAKLVQALTPALDGFDVSSQPELEMLLRLVVDPEKITLTAPAKGQSLLNSA